MIYTVLVIIGESRWFYNDVVSANLNDKGLAVTRKDGEVFTWPLWRVTGVSIIGTHE